MSIITTYSWLLWKTTYRDSIIITLSDLGRKNESRNITILEQRKFETLIKRLKESLKP